MTFARTRTLRSRAGILFAAIAALAAPAAPATANTPAADPESLLVTGADADDGSRYWSCTQSGAEGRFPLRLWRDGAGRLGESAVRWQPTSSGGATLTTADAEIGLQRIVYAANTTEIDRFSTVGDGGARVECLLRGPSRVYGADLFDDDSDIVTSTIGGRHFECVADGASAPGTRYAFAANRTGTSDAGTFRWFWEDDAGIVISAEGGTIVLADLRLDPPASGAAGGFDTRIDGVANRCLPIA